MNNKSIRFITEMGIFTALGLALDFLAGLYSQFIWALGGSISIAMVPILIMSFRWGLKGGLVSGLLIGSLQMLWGSIYHPIQGILDYPVAYVVIGLAGFFANKIASQDRLTSKLYFVNNAILIVGFLRLVAHVVSGYIYFGQYVPEGLKDFPLAWSIIYNLGYMVPSIILCILVVRIFMVKYENFIDYQG